MNEEMSLWDRQRMWVEDVRVFNEYKCPFENFYSRELAFFAQDLLDHLIDLNWENKELGDMIVALEKRVEFLERRIGDEEES